MEEAEQQQSRVGPLPESISVIVNQFFERFGHLREAGQALIVSYRALVDLFENGGVLYLCGNGGSFADAMHIKGELSKSFEKPRPLKDPEVIDSLKRSDVGKKLVENLEVGFPVIVLGESHSLRSAYGNDRDPVYCYAQELNTFAGHIKPAILMGISTSGNARNVAAAMTLARAYGITTISFTSLDGGEMAELADVPWRVPGKTTAEIQEHQVMLYHTLCRMIEEYFFGKKK